MICKSCNREIPEGSVFCMFCGERVARKKREKKKEISVPKPRQLPSGAYFAQVMVDGRRVSINAPTEQEYYARARATKAGLLEIKKALPKMTIGKAIDIYLEENSNVLSPSTIKGYKSVRNSRFQGIMDRDIGSDINWQKAVNDEASAGISAKTLSNSWRVITVALKAQGAEIPAVKLPKVPKAERPWLDYKQIKTFLTLIEGQPCELAALLALHSLRRSELLALTSDHIDLAKGTITVSGAAVYDKDGNFVRKDTNKNVSSQRVVPIVIPRLRELLEGLSGQLITSKPNTTYVQVNRLCEANGLPLVGVHGLRHSFASLAYHLGWSEATTMQVGGWSDSKVVHNIYTHLADMDKNKDIKKMQRFYSSQITNKITNTK